MSECNDLVQRGLILFAGIRQKPTQRSIDIRLMINITNCNRYIIRKCEGLTFSSINSSFILKTYIAPLQDTTTQRPDLPPELRTISLPPPPSLPITRHPPPLSVTPGLPLKIKMSSLQPLLP